MPREPIDPSKPPPFDKRLVLLVTSGRYAGLHQINGTVGQLRAKLGALPEFIEDVTLPGDGRKAQAGMVSFKNRFVLYKECAGALAKPLGQFHPEQR